MTKRIHTLLLDVGGTAVGNESCPDHQARAIVAALHRSGVRIVTVTGDPGGTPLWLSSISAVLDKAHCHDDLVGLLQVAELHHRHVVAIDDERAWCRLYRRLAQQTGARVTVVPAQSLSAWWAAYQEGRPEATA